jgi:hypothetical protein
MSDFNSSLPVRTEHNGDVVTFLADGSTPSQVASVDSHGSQSTLIKDASGSAVTTQANGAQQSLDTRDQADGPVAPGTAANFSTLMGGQHNTVLPTLTNGQQAALQVDASGRLLISNSLDDHNWGTVGANTLRTAAEIGNATGAADFNFGAIGAQTLRVSSQIANATGAADFNAGATGAQTLRVTANQGAPGTNANAWFVHPTDGTNNQVFTATGQATVIVTSPLPAGTNSIGTVVVSNLPTTVDTNWGVVGANTLRSAAEIGNATGAADFNWGAVGAQTLRVAGEIGNAAGAADFNAGATTAQTLRVAANMYDSTGANITPANPLPVTFDTVPGTTIDDYKDAVAIAVAASDTHDYTVTAGKTFYFDQVIASASGKMKMLVAVETGVATGVFTNKFVQFNSTAETNADVTLSNAIPVAAGVRVRVTLTNLDMAAQDLYSTICGFEK